GKQRPRALAGATCALLCLCFAAGLASCQSPPAAPTLMPGIAEAEQVSLQDEWVWDPEQECAPCHSLEAQTAAASACTGFSSAPSRCLGCHDACQALAAAHEDIRSAWQAPEPTGPEIGKEACARCHDAASLTARTADSRALVDGNNVTINPHALLETAGHTQIDCTACHTMHETSDVVEASPKSCRSCHHADSFACDACHS
ncbi:cytochrome c3 family protein, partial [Adlercreutzia sp.]|uniref:cytochrome c3 family protein n=1 Tax=Adlercreutzia sp. TaxID=1872387 RepID=UPI003AF065D9